MYLSQCFNIVILPSNSSPAQLFMNRTRKTKIPIAAEPLKPTLYINVQDRLKYRSERNESYF